MSETERLLVIKAALMQTTSTVGWTYIKQMSKNIVEQATQSALNEKDRDRRSDLAASAASLRDAFNEFFSVIEASKSFGTEAEPDWFSELSKYEEMAHGRADRTES